MAFTKSRNYAEINGRPSWSLEKSYLHLILIFCKNYGTYICQRTKTVIYIHFSVYCRTIAVYYNQAFVW